MTDLEERWAHEDEIQSYRIALAERGRTIRALKEQVAALEARVAEREAEIHVLRARIWEALADRLDAANAEAAAKAQANAAATTGEVAP